MNESRLNNCQGLIADNSTTNLLIVLPYEMYDGITPREDRE